MHTGASSFVYGLGESDILDPCDELDLGEHDEEYDTVCNVCESPWLWFASLDVSKTETARRTTASKILRMRPVELTHCKVRREPSQSGAQLLLRAFFLCLRCVQAFFVLFLLRREDSTKAREGGAPARTISGAKQRLVCDQDAILLAMPPLCAPIALAIPHPSARPRDLNY